MSALNAGSERFIISVDTQYEILTYPGQPKLSEGTRRSSYFFALSQNAPASSSGAYTNR